MAWGFGSYTPATLGGGDIVAFDTYDIRRDIIKTSIHHMKVDDLLPVLQVQVLSDGDPVDLTNYTVVCSWKDSTGTLKVNGAAGALVDAASGKISFSPSGTDTDTAGDFTVEFKLTAPGSEELRIPNSPSQLLTVRISAQVNT